MSERFEDEMFSKGAKRLKKDAFPTLFNILIPRSGTWKTRLPAFRAISLTPFKRKICIQTLMVQLRRLSIKKLNIVYLLQVNLRHSRN